MDHFPHPLYLLVCPLNFQFSSCFHQIVLHDLEISVQGKANNTVLSSTRDEIVA